MEEPSSSPGLNQTRIAGFGIICSPVFWISSAVIAAFVLFGAIFPDTAERIFEKLQTGISEYLGWYYVLVVTVFLVFSVYLMFSRYGGIRLGDQFEAPRFSYAAWFAMLFSAGMGIGLLFWSIAEPMYHYLDPPHADGETSAAAAEAMRYTFFHWGLHAWAIYIVVGLSLAYYAYRHNLPLLIRSSLYPFIGDRIYGPWGHLIDIVALFGTMFGVATSLGLGVMQINSGLNYVFGIEESTAMQIILVAIITLIAVGSVALGVDRGIKRLSNFNIGLAVILLALLLIMGPTLFILRLLVESTGVYVQHLPEMSLWADTIDETGWATAWTIFYWGWWISWAPYVGMFIARVSRGRTIREFVAGVLLAPTAAAFVWLSVFGGTAMGYEVGGVANISGAVEESVSTALFATIEAMPLWDWLAVLAMAAATVLIVTFFVTSSDSGSLVIDTLASGDVRNPTVTQRVYWAILEGVVASILLLAGGLAALQAAAISVGLPFSVVMLVMVVGLWKSLHSTEAVTPTKYQKEAPPPHTLLGYTEDLDDKIK
ncbi:MULTISPECIES: BCCT family transporter [unclassified Thioalkalivibrio]|uniref:BCCT family transporter n=1 Tax=unclassified Thioalkalivibrio TaxID=2621013 RepID=UPI0003794897|nr:MULTISPECIES: BCCT family transporter [unclassified Thioalkalivibrio]